MHLIIDGVSSNIQLMTTQALIYRWLYDAVKIADMSPEGEPVIKSFAWPGSTDSDAISAYQFIKESGIAVHCYPERQFVFIDVFSCKEFDLERMIDHIIKQFKIKQPRVVILRRGVDMNSGKIIPATFESQEDLNGI